LLRECRESKDLLLNKVKFVTFNYDMSLDYALLSALLSTQFIADGDAREFMTHKRVFHVYGSVRSPENADSRPPHSLSALNPSARNLSLARADLLQFGDALDYCWTAAKNIRIIEDGNQKEDVNMLREIKDVVSGSKILYILGYGFERLNSERIGLDQLRNSPTAAENRTVMYTNFGDQGTVNREAGQTFYGKPNAFMSPGGMVIDTVPGHLVVHKSVRDVYGALSSDFPQPT